MKFKSLLYLCFAYDSAARCCLLRQTKQDKKADKMVADNLQVLNKEVKRRR